MISIAKNSKIAFFSANFDELFSGFRDKLQKRVTCVAFSIEFAKTNKKFSENSEICKNYSSVIHSIFIIIHSCPYSLRTDRHA